jgi:5'-deoxynucleotidase YfbR-like HD superfamily hydrolase
MKAYDGSKPYIFVSYAHANSNTVVPILEHLNNAGYRFWFDEGIYSGDMWREAVASHLLSSKCVLAFISKEFSESKNCKDEINLAHEHSTIIPVFIDSMKTPDYLSAGMLMILSGYNAIYGLDYVSGCQIESLVDKICNSIEMDECKIEESKEQQKIIKSSLKFSESFLHSGALSIKDSSFAQTENEVGKISRLFNEIFYAKHFDAQLPAKNIADTIITIIKNNVSNNRKNLLKIKGPLGSYKNRLLQYIYLLLEKEDNGILPFYIDLSMYEKSIEKGSINEKGELEQLVQKHFDQVKTIISEDSNNSPIVIIDGVRDFSSGHDRIYSITKKCLSQINCKVIISLDTDFTNNHKFALHPLSGSDFEYFIRINSMNTNNKDICIEFIKNCLDTFHIALPSNTVDATFIYNRLLKLNILNLDAYWISNILREMLGNVLNPDLTISDLYELICKKELDDSQINAAAQLAYDYEYGTTDFSNSDFYFDVRWKTMRKHRSVLEYLIARYYVIKFNELDIDKKDIDEKQLHFFSMILPKSITVFVTPMINQLDAFESKILRFATRYYDSFSVLEKNQLIFLLGRLKNRTSIEESKALLKTYYKAAYDKYSNQNTTVVERVQNAFLLRTISISLMVLGEKQIADCYFYLLLNDKLSNEVNRGFHLIYYGDKSYIPNKTRLELSDDPQKGKMTFNALYSSIVRKTSTHTYNSMLFLELFTLCSLIQARIEAGNINKSGFYYKYTDVIIDLLEDVLSNRRIREFEKLKLYFQWIKLELEKYYIEKVDYSSATIYNDFNNACTIKRTGWVRRNIPEPENIVEHMYNCWLMAALYLPESVPEHIEYDKKVILNMLLIHDLGEYKTGDIARPEKEKNRALYDEHENEVMQGLLFSSTYPSAQNMSFLSKCWDDWFYTKDINYEIAKDIDNIQAIYQFCKYYCFDNTRFDEEDARNWIEEIYEIKTSIGRGIVKKLILNNPLFVSIVKDFCDEVDYYE